MWIAGPPARRQEALDAELAYFRAAPGAHGPRVAAARRSATCGPVHATRSWSTSTPRCGWSRPSGQAATALVDFWRARTEQGELICDFTDPELSTRFLGDLYQDLSDYAKKTYALLQTPEFVEEFILDQTMEPALAERPLEGFG